MGSVDVMLVDDHEVVRAGLRASLERWGGSRVLDDLASGGMALRRVRELRPDVAIVDFRLGDMRGDDLCRKLLTLMPELRVIMLSSYLSEDAVRAAHRAGAWRYVTKSAGLGELRSALEEVRAGVEPQTADQAASVVARQHRLSVASPPVTAQQSQVLELAAAGLTDREIGQELFLAESTVRFHIQKLKSVLRVRNKTELVATAIRRGLVSATEEL